jgi:hypothetical protein
MEKVPAALAGRGTDIRSHLCRETRDIYVPCDWATHANPDLNLSHPRHCVRGEAETPTREKKTGGKYFNPSLQRGFIILIIGNSVGLESFETSYIATLNTVFIETFSSSYLLLILSPTMSSVNSISKMLERLGFIEAAATYLTGTCGIDSLYEITYLDGSEDVDTMIKGVTNPGGTVTTGTGTTRVTSRNNGIPVSIRSVANLKLCVYYLKHMERVQRLPVPNAINLVLVRSYQDQQRHEVGFKKTAEEPEINDKDWPRTLEKIKEYLASKYGVTGATLDYVVRSEIAVKPEAEDPPENYETVDQEMTARAPHTGRPFVNDRRKVWDIMSNIYGKHSCFVYIKPDLRTRNGRDAYMLLFDHFLGPKNVGNMASEADTKLTSTLYNSEKKRFTWETYVRIHTEQH